MVLLEQTHQRPQAAMVHLPWESMSAPASRPQHSGLGLGLEMGVQLNPTPSQWLKFNG